MNLVEIDDGFKPGKTDKPTLLAVNQAKQCRDFVCVFDDLLDDLWCDRAYEYSARVHGGRPWGVYVSTSDLLDIEGIRCEDIWEEAGSPQRRRLTPGNDLNHLTVMILVVKEVRVSTICISVR